MKKIGTVVRGIRTGVIKEGDNLADIRYWGKICRNI